MNDDDMSPAVRKAMDRFNQGLADRREDERLHGIAKALGLRLEDITTEPNEGASDGYGWGAWVGEYELGCIVGTGRTQEAAIEDLLDQLAEHEKK